MISSTNFALISMIFSNKSVRTKKFDNMHTTILLLFCVLLCTIPLSYTAPDGDKDPWTEKMKKCGDGEVDVKELVKGQDTCKLPQATTTQATRRRRSPVEDGASVKKGGPFDANMCVAVCQWKTQGILDESGKFNETGCKEHIDKVYPEKYRNDAMKSIKECVTSSSSKFLMDDTCSGYKEFASCTHGAHMKICGIK